MSNTTPSSVQEALAAGDLAAAEAGPGRIGTTTVSCEVLCIGVFFDGTNNSREHVGMPGINWHTNVDFLERLYAEGVPDTGAYQGQIRQFIFGKHYARGIAVAADGRAQMRSGAIGTGEDGVADRVSETIDAVNRQIAELVAGKQVCDIVLDVFGFSRGASAARYFANQVRAWAVGAEHGGATVRFLGLFDTVSSIYFPGRTTGLSDLPLKTSGLHGAEILHITAEDELRRNFPLTRSYGREIGMVGAHADIGGGRYQPGVAEQGIFDYSPYVASGTHEWIMERWGLDGSRAPFSSNEHGESLSSPGVPTALMRGGDRAMLNWSAEHGLQNVSLRIMFDAAKRAGVPLPPEVPDTIAGQDVSLHGDLHQYYAMFRDNGVCADRNFKDRIRRRYAQFCGRNDEVNALEVTGRRRESRL